MDLNHHSTPISDRFSYNNSSLNTSSSSSGGKHTNRALASFQIIKCNKCQIQVTRKDFTNHRDHVCTSFIESYYQLLSEDKSNDGSILKERGHLFETPFLIGNILYTPFYQIFSKEKLKNEAKIDCDEDVILLSPELMEHYKLKDGDHVSILDYTENINRGYFTIRTCTLFKNCLAVGSVKDIFGTNKKMITKPTVLKIQLKITCSPLKSLYVQLLREFYDPIIYLNVCCLIKKNLITKVIKSDDDRTSVIVNDVEYELIIQNKVVADELPDRLENSFENLIITEKNSNKNHLANVINKDTRIIFAPMKYFGPKFNKMVGYEKQMELLRSLAMKTIAAQNDRTTDACQNQPKFILLTGQTGTGKTFAVKNLIKEFLGKMNITIIPSALILSKSFDFEKMCQVFRNQTKLEPSLLFLDNLEDMSSDKNKTEKCLISWLKYLFDYIPEQGQNMIIGATNRPELLSTSLRRSERFDIEIDFPVPSPSDRRLIFNEILNHLNHNLTTVQIDELANIAHGFTGADLKSICRNNLLLESAGAILKYENLKAMLGKTKPSAMREIILEKPNVHWSDIGGLNDLKSLLEECVVWPIKHPEAFLRLGIDPPKGILMYGPPGCCKTMIGKALANESGLNFFSIKGPELFSKWVGESERAIREIFRKARAASPSILFFDEIDALATERGQTNSAVGDRVLAQLLTEIDGVEKLSKVIIIAATNRPDIVDKALLRPGRLDSVVYVPLPDLETRKEIFRIRLSRMPLDENIVLEEFVEKLAHKSNGYSGAEINAICQRAALLKLKNNITDDQSPIEALYFEQAFQYVRPQTSEEAIKFFETFSNRYHGLNDRRCTEEEARKQ